MKQRSFASLTIESKKKPARRGRLPGEISNVLPWAALLALTAPNDPTFDRCSRPPTPAGTPPRINLVAGLLIERLTRYFRSPLTPCASMSARD